MLDLAYIYVFDATSAHGSRGSLYRATTMPRELGDGSHAGLDVQLRLGILNFELDRKIYEK
jgi:uncharacterized protein involved in high-affinity Fe2+ transport